MKVLIALLSGILFGLGLVVSEMTNPNVVISFLDLAGKWDPRLLVLMASALVFTTLGFYMIFKRKKPLIADSFNLPQLVKIDKQLLLGAICFGAGWGLAGYCPGPVIAGVTINPSEAIPFIVAMLVGMKVANWQKNR